MEKCGPGLQNPSRVRGMLRTQVSSAGDSEVLVLLVPGRMQVTSDTSFITVSFAGNISEGCMGPRLGAGPGCDPLFPGKKYSLQIMKGTHGGLERRLSG